MLSSFRMPRIRQVCLSVFLGAVAVGLTGCAADRPADVPKSAMLKTQGNQRVVYAAEDDGTVWVTEPASNQIVWSGPVARGDRVVLDPVERKLLVNRRGVGDPGGGPPDHKGFFLPRGAPPAPPPARGVRAARANPP